MKTILCTTMLGLAAAGLSFGQTGGGAVDGGGDAAADAGEVAGVAATSTTIESFEFKGGTLPTFAERLIGHTGVANLNVIVTEGAKDLVVPPMRVRRVSAKVLLETASQLCGAEISMIESERGDTASAPVYILETREPPEMYYNYRRSTTRSTGGGDGSAAKRTGSTTNPFGGTSSGGGNSALGGRASGTSKTGMGSVASSRGDSDVLGEEGGTASSRKTGLSSPFYDSESLRRNSAVKPKRHVVPLFYGYLFADKSDKEGDKARAEALARLGEEAHNYFPDSDTKLSVHEKTQTVVVQSRSREAIDFVKAWLEAQQEAALFNQKAALHKKGIIPSTELLGR